MVRNKGSPTTLEVGKICQTQPPNSQEAARHVLHFQAAPPTYGLAFFHEYTFMVENNSCINKSFIYSVLIKLVDDPKQRCHPIQNF